MPTPFLQFLEKKAGDKSDFYEVLKATFHRTFDVKDETVKGAITQLRDAIFDEIGIAKIKLPITEKTVKAVAAIYEKHIQDFRKEMEDRIKDANLSSDQKQEAEKYIQDIITNLLFTAVGSFTTPMNTGSISLRDNLNENQKNALQPILSLEVNTRKALAEFLNEVSAVSHEKNPREALIHRLAERKMSVQLALSDDNKKILMPPSSELYFKMLGPDQFVKFMKEAIKIKLDEKGLKASDISTYAKDNLLIKDRSANVISNFQKAVDQVKKEEVQEQKEARRQLNNNYHGRNSFANFFHKVAKVKDMVQSRHFPQNKPVDLPTVAEDKPKRKM